MSCRFTFSYNDNCDYEKNINKNVKKFKTSCGLNGRIEQYNECSSLIYFVDKNDTHITIPEGITYNNKNKNNVNINPINYIIILPDGDYTVMRKGKIMIMVKEKLNGLDIMVL